MKTQHLPAGKLVCFGEVLLRLSTRDFLPLVDAQQLEVHFAGAEANVAAQYAAFGGVASMVTRLPENRLAEACLEKMRARGIEVGGVMRGGGRMGLYYLEPGFGARASVITYDRMHSAMAEVRPGEFDWDALFAGVEWFHWSGITPPLGEFTQAVCAEGIAAARRLGVKVSCDVNYRGALWKMEDAARVMPRLVEGTDLLLCGATEARAILGAKSDAAEDACFEEIAASVVQKFGVGRVAMLIRSGETAHEGALRGMCFSNRGAAFSRNHALGIVDRIGSGDSFAGALLFALASGMEHVDAIEFSTAAAVWKHTIPGDWSRGSVAEIEALARGAGGAFVKR
jgi:2-dehydro-3-deoxygluconokinase